MTDTGPAGAPTGDIAVLPTDDATGARIRYAGPVAGLPPQTGMTTDTAVFTDAYAVIPRTVMRDIVTSYLPGWQGMRFWMLARPLTGFAETFSQYIVELAEGGGSDTPDDDPEIQHAIFVTGGDMQVVIDGTEHLLSPGASPISPPARRGGSGTARRVRQGSTGGASGGSPLPAPTSPTRS